jgi:hypothetical protein
LVLGDEDGVGFGVFGLLDYPICSSYGDFHGFGVATVNYGGLFKPKLNYCSFGMR